MAHVSHNVVVVPPMDLGVRPLRPSTADQTLARADGARSRMLAALGGATVTAAVAKRGVFDHMSSRHVLRFVAVLSLAIALVALTLVFGCTKQPAPVDPGTDQTPGAGTAGGTGGSGGTGGDGATGGTGATGGETGGTSGGTPETGMPPVPEGYKLDFLSAWNVSEGIWLLEQAGPAGGGEKVYSLWYPDKTLLQVIIGLADTALFERQEGQDLVFLARGGDDTGNYSFPFEIVYDIPSGQRETRDIFLPLVTEVSFGKDTWARDVAALTVTGDGFTIGFAPRPGAVLAGGLTLPQVTSSYDDEAGVLALAFRNVGVGEEFGPGEAIAPETAGLVKSVTVEPEGTDIRVLVTLGGTAVWNARAEVPSGGDAGADVIDCVVTFQTAP